MFIFKLNIYAVIYANAAFGLIMSILNAMSLHKYAGYKQEIVKTFVIPTLSAAGMGVIVFFVYKLLMIFKINMIATILSIGVGAIAYFVILLLAKGVTEVELRRLPKGYLLVSLAKKARLLK